MTPPALNLTSLPSSTAMPSARFREYATTLKTLLDSRRDYADSLMKLAFLLPPSTELSSTELAEQPLASQP